MAGFEPLALLFLGLLYFNFQTLYKRNKIWGDIAFLLCFASMLSFPETVDAGSYEELIGFLGMMISLLDLGWNSFTMKKIKM